MIRTFVVRHAIVRCDGIEFVRGDVMAVVTRTGADEDTLGVIAECLRDSSPVTATEFELIPQGQDPVVTPVVTVITAYRRDPELHELLWRFLDAAVIER